jgi:hypothetical protein
VEENMNKRKRQDGERLFRVYWMTTYGDSLVWAKDIGEAEAKANKGEDFDLVEYEDSDIHLGEICEPDDEGLEAEIAEQVAEEEAGDE